MALAESVDYRLSQSELRKPLWHEGNAWGEFLALQWDLVLHGYGVPHGDKSPIMTIPGFKSNDFFHAPMNYFLDRINYDVYLSGINDLNGHTDPIREAKRLIPIVKRVHQDKGKRFHLVGHSLGGSGARYIAMAVPESVASITALASPGYEDFEESIDPLVLGVAKASIPTLRKPEELEEIRRQLSQPLPKGIKSTYIHTRDDGVVSYKATMDDDLQTENVDGVNVGFIVFKDFFAIIIIIKADI